MVKDEVMIEEMVTCGRENVVITLGDQGVELYSAVGDHDHREENCGTEPAKCWQLHDSLIKLHLERLTEAIPSHHIF